MTITAMECGSRRIADTARVHHVASPAAPALHRRQA